MAHPETSSSDPVAAEPTGSAGESVRQVKGTSSGSDVWQARIGHEFSTKLIEDAKLLGLENKTEIVRAALEMLHRHAAEVRMAEGVRAYYAGRPAPLPAGVVPFDPAEIDE